MLVIGIEKNPLTVSIEFKKNELAIVTFYHKIVTAKLDAQRDA